MAQCQGKTKKGAQCKRDAAEGSDYCTIHQDQEVRPREDREEIEWDTDALWKAAVGCAIVGALLLFRLRR